VTPDDEYTQEQIAMLVAEVARLRAENERLAGWISRRKLS
jgi:hypothetical protein